MTELREEIIKDWKKKTKELSDLLTNEKSLFWSKLRKSKKYREVKLKNGYFFHRFGGRDDTFLIMDVKGLHLKHYNNDCDCKMDRIAISLKVDKRSDIKKKYPSLGTEFGACEYAVVEEFILKMDTNQIIKFHKLFNEMYEKRFEIKKEIEEKMGDVYILEKRKEEMYLKEMKITNTKQNKIKI